MEKCLDKVYIGSMTLGRTGKMGTAEELWGWIAARIKDIYWKGSTTVVGLWDQQELPSEVDRGACPCGLSLCDNHNAQDKEDTNAGFHCLTLEIQMYLASLTNHI